MNPAEIERTEASLSQPGPISRKEVEAGIKSCGAATDGPWYVAGSMEYGHFVSDGTIVSEPTDNELYNSTGDASPEDDQFVAEARTGWPKALAALQRLFDLCDTDEHIDREHILRTISG